MQLVSSDFRVYVVVPDVHSPGNVMRPAVLNERSGAARGDAYLVCVQVPRIECIDTVCADTQIEGSSARDVVRPAGLVENSRSQVEPDNLIQHRQRPAAEVVCPRSAGLVPEEQVVVHLVHPAGLVEHTCVLESEVFVVHRKRPSAQSVRTDASLGDQIRGNLMGSVRLVVRPGAGVTKNFTFRRDGAPGLREDGRGVISHDELLIDVEDLSGRDRMRPVGGPSEITELEVSTEQGRVAEPLQPVRSQRRTDIGIEDRPARKGNRIGDNQSATVEIDCSNAADRQCRVGPGLPTAACGERPGSRYSDRQCAGDGPLRTGPGNLHPCVCRGCLIADRCHRAGDQPPVGDGQSPGCLVTYDQLAGRPRRSAAGNCSAAAGPRPVRYAGKIAGDLATVLD